MIRAESGHSNLGAAVDERVLHLVRYNPNAVIRDNAQTLGVEVGEREMANFALALQVGEMFERFEIARIVIVPPVKLQQVETLDAHS